MTRSGRVTPKPRARAPIFFEPLTPALKEALRLRALRAAAEKIAIATIKARQVAEGF